MSGYKLAELFLFSRTGFSTSFNDKSDLPPCRHFELAYCHERKVTSMSAKSADVRQG